jgi:tetratricopeptide (TPR) repeat protein
MKRINEKLNRYNDKLTRILDNDELEIVHEDSSYLIDFGYESIEIGDFDKAYDLFMLNLGIDGESPDALNGVAIALCEMGKKEIGLKIINKASEQYPDDAITLANTASISWENGDFARAVQYYHKSIEADPSQVETFLNLAELYLENGFLPMALASCMNAMKNFPDNKQLIDLNNDIILEMAISAY